MKSVCLAMVMGLMAGLVGCVSTSHDHPVVVDGFFSDWATGVSRVSDTPGDAVGTTDVVSLAGQRRGDYVFLRLEIAQPANLHKPAEGGGLRIHVTGTDETFTLDTGIRTAEINGQPVPWPEIAYIGLPTHSSTEFEIRMRAPRGALSVSITGSDELETPLKLDNEASVMPIRKVDVARGDAVMRVVIWNVLHGGPFGDPEREAAGREVFEILEPDVLLLQEVWEVSDLEQRVHDLCGDDWNLHEFGGVAVASPLPLTLLELDPPVELDHRRRPAGGDSWSNMRNLFVGVDTPIGPVVMVSSHWQCCGSAGSTEDIQRMDDALTALKAIWRLRDSSVPDDGRGDYKAPVPERFSNAPIMIAGDYNLVGSRAPLDMLLTHGFIDLLPIRSNEWITSTWRSPEDEQMVAKGKVDENWEPGGFPQGRLDFALVEPELSVMRSFIADLDEPTMLSDHLPIVVDFDQAPD